MTKPKAAEFHIPSLDGIRAVAALIVVFAHAGYSRFISGRFGVTVFFFLSGFLITTLLRKEVKATGRVHFAGFYLRRAYRLFPPLYVTLGVIMLLCFAGFIPHEMTPAGVASQFLYWTNYYLIAHGPDHFVPYTDVTWSLAVEEHFYFLFPLVFSLLYRRWKPQRFAVFLGAICALVLAWRFVLIVYLGSSQWHTHHATDTRFDSILIGCIMGVWSNPVLDADWRMPERGRAALLVVSLAVLAWTFGSKNEVFRETIRYTIQGVALFPIFWLAVKHPNWIAFRWLNAGATSYLGKISYSIYLVHPVALYFAGKVVPGQAAKCALGLAITIAVASVMYYVIEKPAARIRRRLHEAAERPTLGAAAVAVAAGDSASRRSA